MESRLSPAGLKSLVGHSLRRTIGPVERLCGIETDAASIRAIWQLKEVAASVLNQRRRRAYPRAGPGDVELPRRRAKKILAALVRRPGDGEGRAEERFVPRPSAVRTGTVSSIRPLSAAGRTRRSRRPRRTESSELVPVRTSAPGSRETSALRAPDGRSSAV